MTKLDLTRAEIDMLWEAGYRPFEIYTCNEVPITYYGEKKAAGEVTGWEIKHVFAKRADLPTFPFFDTVICGSDVGTCEAIWPKP